VLLILFLEITGAFSLTGLKYTVDPPPGREKGPLKEGDVEFHFYSR